MPTERVYTIRGKNPKALTHRKIQLSSYDPTAMYRIEEFKVMPAGNPTNSDCYGTVSMGKNNNIDPSDPDFSNQNEIAWSHHAVQQPVPPGIGESVTISNYEVNDEKLFNYDVWVHTKDLANAEEVNYFLKIRRYSTDDVTGSIGSLRQYQYNDQQNQ